VAFEKLELDDVEGGVRLRVRLSPGARRQGVLGAYGDALKVAVHAPPERGRANEALLDLLARTLGVSRASLRLLAGHTARDKTVLVHGLPASTIRERLAHAS